MFALIKKMMPREDKYFDMFEAHAAKSLAAARKLRTIMDGGKGTSAALMAALFYFAGAYFMS